MRMLARTGRPGTGGRRRLLALVTAGATLALVDPPSAEASRRPLLDGAPVSVSLSAPASVPKGDTAVFGVALTAPDTRLPVAGGTVVLDRRDAGTKRWREAARSVTDTRGHIVFTVRIRSSQDFRARALPNDWFAAGRSGILRVRIER
jgi:hypothetical protein